MAQKKKRIAGGAATEPSVRAWTAWNPALIRSAEMAADGGNIRLAASVCDWLLSDDRVASTLTTRAQALLGLTPSFEASGDKRRSSRTVKALDAGEDYWKTYPEHQLAQLITWGLMLGAAPAQNVWTESESGRLLPVLEFWHPQNLRRDQEAREWKVRTAAVTGVSETTLVPGDGQWILHTPFGPNRPWTYGFWRGLSWWGLLKFYARSDWARHGERGAVLATTCAADEVFADVNTKEYRQALAQEIYDRGREAVVALPPGFDLKLVEATANTRQIYEAQINAANEAIAILVRGSNLGTSVSESGSRAAAESQYSSSELPRLKFDAQALAMTLHDQSLVHWAEYNFGDSRLAPWPVYPVEPEEDLKARADVEEKALGNLETAERLGLDVNRRLFLETHKIEWAKPGAQKPPETPPEVAPAPEADPEAKPAEPNPKQDESKAQARSLRSGDNIDDATGFVNGQDYIDDIVEQTTAYAARVLEHDVASVIRAVGKAASYDEVRANLLETFGAMDPSALTQLVERAWILSQLAGKAAVLEDL